MSKNTSAEQKAPLLGDGISPRDASYLPLLSSILLVLTNIFFSCFPPALKYSTANSGISPRLFCLWQAQICFVLFAISLVFERRWSMFWGLSRKSILMAIGTGIVEGILDNFIASATLRTSAFHMAIFMSLSPFINTISSLVCGMRLSRGEIAGTLLCFLGAVLSVLNPSLLTSADTPDSDSVTTLIGDLFAFLGCLMVIVLPYFTCAAREEQTPVQLGFFACLSSAVTLCTIALSLDPVTADISKDGLFGWLAVTSDPSCRLVFVFSLASYVAKVATDFALKYASTDVFLLCSLLDIPFMGTIAWLIGVDSMPNAQTLVGGGVVLSGLAMVIRFQVARLDMEEAQKVMRGDEEDAAPAAVTAS